MLASRLNQAVSGLSGAMLDFAQRLIQTPSPSGEEGDLAELVSREMTLLGYDGVEVDAAGNVVGHLRGGPGRSLMLNTHLDHVDPGATSAWPHPPFGGVVEDGQLWGRGAMDIKGPLASQVYAPAVLSEAGLAPPGDLYVTATVMEEVGGIGALCLAESLRPDMAVIGEATGCKLARGHRGRVEIELRFTGRGGHASMPEAARNPHYAAARFLETLAQLTMRGEGASFGKASVAPTLYRSDPSSRNVIPQVVELVLDWRSVPEEGPEMILDRVRALAEQAAGSDFEVSASVPNLRWQTYTGLVHEGPMIFPAFELEASHPLYGGAQALLAEAFGEPAGETTWQFATDGGHFMAAGIPCIGFGPGQDSLAHTTEERVSVVELEKALLGNAALCAGLGVSMEEDQRLEREVVH